MPPAVLVPVPLPPGLPAGVGIRSLTPDDWPAVERLFGPKGACGGCCACGGASRRTAAPGARPWASPTAAPCGR